MKNLFLLIAFMFLIAANSCKKDDAIKVGKSTAVFNSSKIYGTVKDIDGNIYKTITLGTQTWMAENLRTTHYQNGDTIPNVKGVKDPSLWGNLITGAYCTYNNTSDLDSIATFGLLYNGYAVTDSRNIAPEGWHVPTDAEWNTLETFVAAGDAITDDLGNGVAGGRLKEVGILHFGSNNHADNSSGFTALPGGERSTSYNEATYSSAFWFIGYFSAYWTTSEADPPPFSTLFMRLMVPDFTSITRNPELYNYGISVRCIKDE